MAVALLVGAEGRLESPLELAAALGAYLVAGAEDGEGKRVGGGPTSK